MANKGFGAEKINLIGGGTPTVSSPTDLNLTADNVAISTNASIGGKLVVSGGLDATGGIATAGGFYGPIYVQESPDDNQYYDIPFVTGSGSANDYRNLMIDYGQLQFNASDNTLRLYGGMNATNGFSIGIQSGGQNIVNQSTQYLEGINFAGVGNSISYNTSTRYVTVEIAGGSGGAGVGTDTSINTTGIITAAAFNSPYYNSGVPYIGVGAGATQIEFQAANVAITTDMTVGGAINAAGAVFSGIATGTFVGDGSGLTGLVAAGSGVQVRDDGSLIGIAQTINFGSDLAVSPISAGIVTVSNTLNLAGIDTAGVSHFNHIDAAGIITATTFDSDGTGSPNINSGIYTTLSINSPTVAISTNMTVGGDLTVVGTINGSNLGGTLEPDGITMLGQKYLTFYKDNSTALASHNSEMYGTSYGTTIWREYSSGAGDGIRIGTKELTVETQGLYGYMAKFTQGGPVWLSWGGHTGDGNEHKQKLATNGIGVSVLYDYQTLGHMDVRDINATGVVTATTFIGDGSGLTGVTAIGSGIEIRDSGVAVGAASTVDFGTNLSVSAVSAGVVTVTASGGGGYTAGIDTTGVSHFNHIHAVGVITANSFTSNAGSASSIKSPGTLTIEAPLVAFSTAVSIGSTLSLFDGELNFFKNISSGNVVIQETGTGSLNINANDLQIKDYLGQETKAKFISNGGVELYYDDSKKFETTGNGIEVTGHSELDNVSVAGVTTFAGIIDANGQIVGVQTNNVIPFYYDNVSDFPSASTYHGAFAHAHNSGRAYFAHAGWKELVNKESNGIVGTGTESYNVGVVTAQSFIGDGSGLTGVTASGSGINVKDSGSIVGVAATIDFGNNLNVSPASAGIVTVSVASLDTTIDSHLNSGSASSGEVLSWTGTDYDWVVQSGGSSYTNSDVDTHLNVSGASSGEILSWNGSDYAWVTDQTGGGGGGGSSDPVGTIVAWSGSGSSIPSEYQICDGSSAATSALEAITGANVPDLRDKFIVGAFNSTGDTTYPGLSPGATGGSATATLVSHSHTVNSHSHSFSDSFSGSVSGSIGNADSSHTHSFNTSSSGNHNHNVGQNIPLYVPSGDSDRGSGSSTFSIDSTSSQSISSAGSHSHSGSTGGNSNSHSHSFSGSYSGSVSGTTGNSSPATNSQGTSSTNANLPPYYALCYIVKHTATSGGGSIAGINTAGTSTFNDIISNTLNVSGIITATSFQGNSTTGDGSDRGFTTKYYITSSGSSGYNFAGPGVLSSATNPTLYFHRGFTYILENSTGSGHPFALRVSNGGSNYAPGGNFLTGSQNGTQILTVPFDAPNSIVYQCTLHSGMVGTINFVS